MAIFEGKSPAERNKIIAAIVLGVLAIASLTYTFGGALFSSGRSTSPAAVAETTPTVVGDVQPERPPEVRRLPEQDRIEGEYASIPINYMGSNAFGVPITGRNIFAFWEPGDPTPVPSFTPTPAMTKPVIIVPPPEPKIFLSFVTPQSVYAGSKEFRLEVNGDKFTPDSRIIFNGSPLPTTYLSEQRLSANISASLISRAYNGSIMVDTPGTEYFSRQITFAVMEPPKPDFEYIGMIARRHYNNDTAYFQDKGAKSGDPFSARLNDVVKGRFRVVSISAKEVEFQDTRLGFRHKLPLLRPEPGTADGTFDSGYDDDEGFDPNMRSIPGIPDNIRRATPIPGQNINPTLPTDSDQKVPDPDN